MAQQASPRHLQLLTIIRMIFAGEQKRISTESPFLEWQGLGRGAIRLASVNLPIGGSPHSSHCSCSPPPARNEISPAHLCMIDPGNILCKAQSLRGLTHPSKAGCDFLSILTQAPVWAGLLWKACFVHHSASSCLSSCNATRPRPAQNGTSSQAPSSISSPLIIQILHKIC